MLDRNPENFFAEVEQAAFSPANLVPGTGLSPDKMLMGRIFSYHDTHLHRIGPNYEQLPINAAQGRSALLQQGRGDDLSARRITSPSTPRTPTAARRPTRRGPGRLSWMVNGGELGRFAYDKHADDDDFGQPGTLYREVMSDADREHLVANIVGHASDRSRNDIQLRVVAYWTSVDRTSALGWRLGSATVTVTLWTAARSPKPTACSPPAQIAPERSPMPRSAFALSPGS